MDYRQEKFKMAQNLTKEKTLYNKEKERFLKELQHFHETRGTPFRRIPKINGYEVDLYLLYTLVTGRGGWVKVNSRNEWNLILKEFLIPKHCVNSAVAIKQIYLRYLDRYEKMHFLGEVGERACDDDEDSRHRRWSARALHSVPLSYNHAQHNFNDSLRDYNGLSVNLYRESEYEKLGLSLISPLPNEQDFAINVCTVLSNEGKHNLKLEKHPRILHYLMAHAAVFSEQSLKNLFYEFYGPDRGHSMHYFWYDVVNDKDMLKLIDGNLNNEANNPTKENKILGSKFDYYLDSSDRHLFCLGRTLGTNDYLGQRVTQIADILRNLTFTPENASFMAHDITFLRFVLLCCCSSWNDIAQIGWDMLSNISAKLPCNSPLTDEVIQIAKRGLLSEDRAVILNSLDVINKLAHGDSNELLLHTALTQEVFDRVCSFLTLHDIMLLVCALECLYAVSSLGKTACNYIVRVRGAIDVLVSLITVEAQSFGQKACILMRVIETVTGNSVNTSSTTSNSSSSISQNIQSSTVISPIVSSSSPSYFPSTVTSASIMSSSINNMGSYIPTPSAPLAVPLVATITATSTSSTITTPLSSSSTHQLQSPFNHSTHISPPSISNTSTTSVTSPRASPSFNPSLATQQVAQENEQFALAWLRSTFEPQVGSSIDQAELYKQYINYCASIGRRGVIAPLHFPRCVRSVFGGSVGPKVVLSADGTQQSHHHYEGIKLRSKPLIPTTPNTAVFGVSNPISSLPSTPSPILKAQLSAPPKPSPQVSPVTTKLTPRHAQPRLMQPPNILQVSSIIRPLLEEKPHPHQIASKKFTSNCRINGVRADGPDKQVDSIGVIISCDNHLIRPPTLARQLACNNNIKLPTLTSTSLQKSQHLLAKSEENSATNVTSASSTNRDNCLDTDEAENSVGSLDGFQLNGASNTSDTNETTNKESTPKSLMLADLLEKNIERNEPPPLNGALRLVERGLEMVHPTSGTATMLSSGNSGQVNGSVNISTSTKSTLNTNVSNSDLKRPSIISTSDVPQAKKPHLNGDIKQEPEHPEEGNVSTSAANLYAALAADTLEDEPIDVLRGVVNVPTVGAINTIGGMVQGQVLVQTSGGPVQGGPHAPRQIFVTAGTGLTQRVVVGGQHYVVAQPQTALVPHGTQTVLVAQTAQQQGTGAKTIIILQPQGVTTAGTNASPNTANKMLMQRIGASPPPNTALSRQNATTTNNHLSATPSAATTNQSITSHPTHIAHHIKKTHSTAVTTISSSTVTGIITATCTNPNVSNVSMPAIPAPCATPVTVISNSKSCITTNDSPIAAITTATTTVPTTRKCHPTQVKINTENQGHFLCEWRGCMRNFKSGNEVYMHACETHCPQGTQEIQCLWERCDAMKRKRFSLMTHLYDRHCNADVMKMMAVRRKQLSVTGRSEIPAPIPATPHPGYAPNAAFHAIKRHALEFVNPKELQQRAAKPGPTPATVQIEQDDNEGPVTKSIRLTAALILRNLVIYSTSGKRNLKRYEAHLASVALSNVESSRTIAQLLFDLNQIR